MAKTTGARIVAEALEGGSERHVFSCRSALRHKLPHVIHAHHDPARKRGEAPWGFSACNFTDVAPSLGMRFVKRAELGPAFGARGC